MAPRPSWYQRALALAKPLVGGLPIGDVERPALVPGQPVKERGVTGTENFGGTISGEEYNPELQGQAGRDIYDKMRRTDAQVRATLQVMKLPLLAAQWAAVPPEGGDGIDQQIADFVNSSLIDDDALVDSWQFILRHILLELDFGFSILEKVWRVDEQGFYRLKRLAPRLPKTIYAWHTARDGSLVRIWQWAPVTKEIPEDPNDPRPKMPPHAVYEYIPIPGNAVCVFTLDREGDNYEGISALRASYRNWYYKDLIYHLDGVRLDRYGVGVPVAELAPENSLNEDDFESLEEALKNLRSNAQTYLIAPPHVKFRIMGPEGGGGAAASAQSLIDHHDQMISRNVLANFMSMGQAPLGMQTFGTRMTDLFISSLYGLAAGISADLKRSVVKPLCDLNFDMTNREYPSVVVRDLESNDIQGMLEVVLKAVGTLITPDDDLEAMLRRALKLPPLPKELSRAHKQEEADQQAAAQAQAQADQAAVMGQVPPEQGVEQGPVEEPPPQLTVVPTGDAALPWGLHDSTTGTITDRFPTEQDAQTALKQKQAGG